MTSPNPSAVIAAGARSERIVFSQQVGEHRDLFTIAPRGLGALFTTDARGPHAADHLLAVVSGHEAAAAASTPGLDNPQTSDRSPAAG